MNPKLESLVGAGKGAEGDLMAKLFPKIALTAVQGVEFGELTRILSHGVGDYLMPSTP